MRDSEKTEFEDLLSDCAAALSSGGKPINKKTVDAYFKILRKWPLPYIAVALDSIMRDGERFPRPGEIIGAIRNTSSRIPRVYADDYVIETLKKIKSLDNRDAIHRWKRIKYLCAYHRFQTTDDDDVIEVVRGTAHLSDPIFDYFISGFLSDRRRLPGTLDVEKFNPVPMPDSAAEQWLALLYRFMDPDAPQVKRGIVARSVIREWREEHAGDDAAWPFPPVPPQYATTRIVDRGVDLGEDPMGPDDFEDDPSLKADDDNPF